MTSPLFLLVGITVAALGNHAVQAMAERDTRYDTHASVQIADGGIAGASWTIAGLLFLAILVRIRAKRGTAAPVICREGRAGASARP